MKIPDLTIEDVRDAGLAALFDALGPANTLRFLQIFQSGAGDYTRERHAWLDALSLDEIMADVREIQRADDAVAAETSPESAGRAR
jgi:hypothetical protein